jgi:hypothetical protein
MKGIRMISISMRALVGSTVIVMAIALAQPASAQSNENSDEQSSYCITNPDKCGGGQQMRKHRSDEESSDDQEGYTKKRKYQEEDQTSDDSDQPRRKRKYQDTDQAEDQSDQPRIKHAEGDWKYDPSRHKRRRHKDDEFRFYFNGFWYPEPYWQIGIGNPYRIGCAEGRSILRDRGFYRVHTVECHGRTFTYTGRRHGDAFRILLSSRSGRIVDVSPL